MDSFQIRPSLSNNWPAPIIAPFWGLLVVSEVHALNLGKQLVSTCHARQSWCSIGPTSPQETTIKKVERQDPTRVEENIAWTTFRDPLVHLDVLYSHEIHLVRMMDGCLLQYPDIFQYFTLPHLKSSGYLLYFFCSSPSLWTVSAEVPLSPLVKRTCGQDTDLRPRFSAFLIFYISGNALPNMKLEFGRKIDSQLEG